MNHTTVVYEVTVNIVDSTYTGGDRWEKRTISFPNAALMHEAIARMRTGRYEFISRVTGKKFTDYPSDSDIRAVRISKEWIDL